MKLLQSTANEIDIKLPDAKGMGGVSKCFSVHDIQWHGQIPTYRNCAHQPSPNHPIECDGVGVKVQNAWNLMLIGFSHLLTLNTLFVQCTC